MITEDNMHSDHFDIKGKDAPVTMWNMYDLELTEELVTVGFDVGHDDTGVMITGAWLGDEEIGLSFSDRERLLEMLNDYHDEQRKDIAEEATS